MSDEEVQQVSEALKAVEAISDREARVLAMSKVMAAQADRNKEWLKQRRELVFELREQGESFRKIAARVGVSLGTVQDILRGHSGAWGTRRASKPPTESS
ncbi:hypothetical protein ADL27_39840 [Streptomyces sp. NRRL F-6602]|nr:hypothetical protein ADL27_39840 [Streptomyces sp. NRRL F-6602]